MHNNRLGSLKLDPMWSLNVPSSFSPADAVSNKVGGVNGNGPGLVDELSQHPLYWPDAVTQAIQLDHRIWWHR
jgi:hypothetical protein